MSRAGITLLACALSGGLAFAQSRDDSAARPNGAPSAGTEREHAAPPDGGRAPTASEVDAALRAHDRARIHPGDPLALVGVEQGGNDARARTPALANSVHTATPIDADENYRRTLAMYESGARFHVPLALAEPDATRAPAAPRNAPSAPAPAPAEASSRLPWIGAALLALGLLAWSFVRFAAPRRAAR